MNEFDLFSQAPVAMAAVARDGNIVRVNGALCDLLGYPAEELVGRTLESLALADDVDRLSAELQSLIDDRSRHFEIEVQFRHCGGRRVWVLLAVSLVRDADGAPLSFVAHMQDFSGRKELTQRMAYLADHDTLTGLFSRHRFDEMLERHCQTTLRYGAHGALLMLDLDRFKWVNDKFGHQAGDDVLKNVAAVLRGRLRDTDVLARLGGDEFAIILPEADLAQAQVVASEIVRVLSKTATVVGKKTVRLTASVGVVAFAVAAPDNNPVAAADAAMYRAKRAGGNRWATGSATGSLADDPWVSSARLLTARPRLAIGCVAALIVATRYGYPGAIGLTVAQRSLAATIARLLAPALTSNG